MTAALFGITLWYPPSLIERIARLREPDLPPGAGVLGSQGRILRRQGYVEIFRAGGLAHSPL